MADTRERLVEILEGAGKMIQFPGTLANILIENGVTIQKWIPVTERVPEKWFETDEEFRGEPIEFIVLIEGALCATTLCFNGKNFFDVRTDYVYDVTHWMPLPEPPKEVE